MSNVLTDEQAKANIAANVARLRGARTRSWLARECGTYPIAITRIERGDHLPTSGLLARLAEALDTTADALLSIDATKNLVDVH
jgi:transcriptional regulator with XRE-family HTH domain